MEVVRNVDQAVLERYLRGAWNRIGGDDGNAVLGKQRWQFVVDQVVVMVGTSCQHHSVGAFVAGMSQHFGAALLKGSAERRLRVARLVKGG